MEIKHTIEILTKDIQDIEKLVGNLQNSQDATAIELDLALSKLRNVYEILTLIKADRLKGLLEPQQILQDAPKEEAVQVSEPEPEPIPEVASRPEPVPEAEPEPEQAKEPAHAAQPEPEPIPELASRPEPVPEAEPEPEQAKEPVHVAEAVPEPEPVQAEDPAPAAQSVPEPEPPPAPEPAPKKQKDAEILAEKFSSESSINENLGGKRGKSGDAKLLGTPIDQISRNIGINDRFLIIRELFEGNSEEFAKLITDLDEAENYEVALRILNAHFAGSMDHEGVEILSGLVKRRYLSV